MAGAMAQEAAAAFSRPAAAGNLVFIPLASWLFDCSHCGPGTLALASPCLAPVGGVLCGWPLGLGEPRILCDPKSPALGFSVRGPCGHRGASGSRSFGSSARPLPSRPVPVKTHDLSP